MLDVQRVPNGKLIPTNYLLIDDNLIVGSIVIENATKKACDVFVEVIAPVVKDDVLKCVEKIKSVYFSTCQFNINFV